MPRFRLQFSLSTLLLITTVVGMSVALGIMYWDLRQAQAQLQKYRNECGDLTISDTNKIHAIRVPANDGDWRWRVFLPEAGDYQLRYRVGEVPSTEIPTISNGWQQDIASGDHVISACVSRDRDGKRVLRVAFSGGSIQSSLEGDAGNWLNRDTDCIGSVTGSTTSVERGKPLVLLRLRAMEPAKPTTPGGTSTSASAPDGPADGIILWIVDKRSDAERKTTP